MVKIRIRQCGEGGFRKLGSSGGSYHNEICNLLGSWFMEATMLLQVLMKPFLYTNHKTSLTKRLTSGRTGHGWELPDNTDTTRSISWKGLPFRPPAAGTFHVPCRDHSLGCPYIHDCKCPADCPVLGWRRDPCPWWFQHARSVAI